MAYYIGLDVSQARTAICIIDARGKVIAEGSSLSNPREIYRWIANRAETSEVAKAGLEAGSLSSWLYTGLAELGLPTVCLETFQAHQFLKTQRNKTDKNDARGLAQLVRMGNDFLKTVTIRRQSSQESRALLNMRQHLVQQKVALENNISGTLKPFGLIVRRGGKNPEKFIKRVIEILPMAGAIGDRLKEIITPSLKLYQVTAEQLSLLTRQVHMTAKNDPVCKRLMTAPGVGPIVSLSFATAVDNPERFKSPDDVGAYFGLTPRQFQSGESNYITGVSKRGDSMVRYHLITAATVVLTSNIKWCSLKSWGVRLAKRQGMAKARVAVARKLAIIMHKMWITGQDFKWQSMPNKELEGLQPA